MDEYRSKYTERGPDSSRIKNKDECFLLSEEHGVVQIKIAPISDLVCGMPPQDLSERNSDRAKFIWVIQKDSSPRILEKSGKVEFLESKRATHTNLTGGKKAYCGGEIWFQSEDTIYISGASGRYPPRDSQELEDICDAFRRLGYKVASLGWDSDRNWPYSLARGEYVHT
ncbi:MAG: hypothetical protein V3W31_04125 [Thermodesulfobacteriota bacterium]